MREGLIVPRERTHPREMYALFAELYAPTQARPYIAAYSSGIYYTSVQRYTFVRPSIYEYLMLQNVNSIRKYTHSEKWE